MRDLLQGGTANTGELLAGRYRLVQRIGEGGMATVYRAEDEALGRTVAVKIFRPGTESDDADLERRMSETRVLASLNHHGLVTLFDARIDSDEGAFLVMEFVDGPTLRARLAEGPLDQSEARSMAIDLAEALHVVHDGGIVHRDIKPSNVLLGPSIAPGPPFRAKLADFGIAYLADSARLTSPGTLIGTAAYLSPEQVRGASPAPSADVYALGLLLLESLTGSRAYPQASSHEALLARLHRSPEIPGSLGYGWKSLLTAMTAHQPDERPTALEVSVAARAIVPDESATVSDATAVLPATADAATDAGGDAATGVAPIPVTDAATELLVVDPVAAELAVAPQVLSSATAPTVRLTETPAAPPETPGTAAPGTTTPAPAALPADTPRTDARRADTRRTDSTTRRAPGPRRWLIVAVLVLLAATAIVLGFVYAGAQNATGPQPTLPALDEPLSTDLQNLMDEVTP
jgi:tRNA A-37 threonylcarbamoyl transferase component Bud32